MTLERINRMRLRMRNFRLLSKRLQVDHGINLDLESTSSSFLHDAASSVSDNDPHLWLEVILATDLKKRKLGF